MSKASRGGPEPSSAAVSVRMQRQKRRETGIELALRRDLHRRGLRYRIHRRPVPGVRREADVVFTRQKVAVFVDGCFWHGCPGHGSWPTANADWWRTKIEMNRARDQDTNVRLGEAGWTVLRVWEHEPAEQAALRIVQVLEGLNR